MGAPTKPWLGLTGRPGSTGRAGGAVEVGLDGADPHRPPGRTIPLQSQPDNSQKESPGEAGVGRWLWSRYSIFWLQRALREQRAPHLVHLEAWSPPKSGRHPQQIPKSGHPPLFFFFATRVRSPRCPTLTPAPGGLEAGNSRDSTLAAGSPSAPWDQPLPHTAPGFPNLSQNPGSQPFPHRGPPQHPPAAPLLHLSPSPDPEFLIFLLYPVHSLVGRAQTNPPGQSSWSIGANSCLGMLGKSAGSDSMLREVNADD